MESHDTETNLVNREFFMSVLAEWLSRDTEQILVFCLSTAQYHTITELYGAVASTELLHAIGQRLQEMIPPQSMVSRFYGDIFYIMQPLTDSSVQENAEEFYAQLAARFEEPVILGERDTILTLHVGVSFGTAGDAKVTARQLAENARVAMASLAAQRLPGLSVYSEQLSHQAERLRLIREQLPWAVERGEMYLVYQPQVDIHSQKVFGVEALLRWENPILGAVPPGEFITIAENSESIHAIGRFVMETAVRQGRLWYNEGMEGLRVSVNVSVSQLRESDFADFVAAVLTKYDFPPESLEIEVTESIALSPENVVSENMEKLNQMGIRLAIDDFGMGHASLSYLKNFQFDTLKVDKVLACDIDYNDVSKAMVSSIHTLCDTLGVEMLVEFVERSEQIEVLRRLKCYKIQGYYFSKPVLAQEFTAFFRQLSRHGREIRAAGH